MVTRLTDRIYDLDMGLAMTLDRQHEKTIRSVETHLWLAEEGWAEDVLLSSGEWHVPKRSGRAVISALIAKARFSLGSTAGWIAGAANVLRMWRMQRD